MNAIRTLSALGAVSGLLLVGVGCDLDQSFVFAGAIEGVPGVQDLGTLTPIPLDDIQAIRDNTIYGEVGPTGTAAYGGITFDFQGVNGDVCVWMDPELAFWNQSVSESAPVPEYQFPDNVFDDGDIELEGGLTVYYTGTPGESIGGFAINFEDSLGNTVPLELVECTNFDQFNGQRSWAGRGSPEFCTISNTQQDVSYTMLLETYSTPVDDSRLGYGLVVTEGTCNQFRSFMGITDLERFERDECMILGESIKPGAERGNVTTAMKAEGDAPFAEDLPLWDGTNVPSWERSVAFEEAFCAFELLEFCRAEKRRVERDGETCSWEFEAVDPSGDASDDEKADAVRCYCGDQTDTPSAGG